MLALVLLLGAVFAWRCETGHDLGFHLASARYILEHHAWPRTDPFTYTVPDHPYIDMHGLFQLLLLAAWSVGGYAGIGVLRVVLVLATLLLLWATARRRGARSPELLGIAMVLLILAWEGRFFARPELATTLLLAAELYLLQRHAESRRPGWLYAIVPLQLVWVYSHALSLFGLAVLGLYAVAGLVHSDSRRDPAPWLALALCGAASLLNPYGPAGLAFLWNLRTRLESGNVFGANIIELRSPWTPPPGIGDYWAFALILLVGGAAVLLRARRLRAFDVALVVVFAWLANSARRNMGLFVLAATPVSLEAAQQLLDLGRRRWAAARRPASWLARHGPRAAMLLAYVALLQTIIGGSYYGRRFERFGWGLSRDVMPVALVDYVERHHLAGPMYNEINFGGYLIGRLWPARRVFVDGRLEVMGEDFYRQCLAWNQGQGWSEMVQRYDPNWVILPYEETALLDQLRADPQWALVELDAPGVLFLRARPQNMALIREAQARWSRWNAPAGAQEGAIVPRPPDSWLGRTFGRYELPWLFWRRGEALSWMGLHEAARKELRRALLAADRDEPPLIHDYVEECAKVGRTEEAAAWYVRLRQLSGASSEAPGPGADQ